MGDQGMKCQEARRCEDRMHTNEHVNMWVTNILEGHVWACYYERDCAHEALSHVLTSHDS